MAEKPKGWRIPVWAMAVVVVAALYVLGRLNARKTPGEELAALVASHRGAVVLVRGGTEADVPFLNALRRIKPRLAGKAGIVITRSLADFPGETVLPLLIVKDSHGGQMGRMAGTLDEAALERMVDELATHHH